MAILAKISTETMDTVSGMRVSAILAKAANQLFSHPLGSICDSFFIFYSLWTLSWILFYFADLPLSAMWLILLLLPPVSVLALAFKPEEGQPTAIAASRTHPDTLV